MANDGKLWRILSAFGPVVISVVLSVKLGPFARVPRLTYIKFSLVIKQSASAVIISK